MHDLESFFWVLFWICIHFDGLKKDRVVSRFDKWNYVDTDERAEDLAGIKLIVVSKEEIFMKTTTNYFTQYYQPLAPLMNSLRKVVFLGDKPWKRKDERLYSRMGEILRKEREDLNSVTGWALLVAKGKTGTRAFMAIGPLLGEQHSFMHDLESFFWVLFWICIHCDGPGEVGKN
ncbi:hypothetical protein QBC46DRAFT_358716 [Diplogelasinospora grovesii]|uniref:Fungal-type protein kinase domain-containing protein n=1 Tax=Diplogelasinospora grovesii TaxID=303347 RepID=A0AAN6RYR0_9PEZI|nr:hypothetical protein QBC46DRAFT_358716 [Diplogelasinospora grovesii]